MSPRKVLSDAEWLAQQCSPDQIAWAKKSMGIYVEIDLDSPNLEFMLPDCQNTYLTEDKAGGFCGFCNRYHWVWHKVVDPNYSLQQGAHNSPNRYYSTYKFMPVIQVIDNLDGTKVTKVTWKQALDGENNPILVKHDRYKEAIHDRIAQSYPVKVLSGRKVTNDMGCLSFGEVPQYDSPMSGELGREYADLSSDGEAWAVVMEGATEE